MERQGRQRCARDWVESCQQTRPANLSPPPELLRSTGIGAMPSFSAAVDEEVGDVMVHAFGGEEIK